MLRPLTVLLLLFASYSATFAATIDFPFAPEESEVVQSMVERVGFPVTKTDAPGWQTNGIRKQLESSGIDGNSLEFFAIAHSDRKQIGVTFAYDSEGRILAIRGNGPWLDNDTLRSFTALPELRAISIDHNGQAGKQETNPFDGSGLEALTHSKLESIKIGLGFDDSGMQQAAKIPTLRKFHVGHSRVTDAGVVFFENHPTIETFSIGEMGQDRVTENALASIAKIPNLREVGFLECYITYDNGFIHLKPLAGQLEKIDLRMSLFSDADLQRLKADHPDAEIITQTPDEIAKGHIWIAKQLTRHAPPEVAAPLEAAIAAREAATKP